MPEVPALTTVSSQVIEKTLDVGNFVLYPCLLGTRSLYRLLASHRYLGQT